MLARICIATAAAAAVILIPFANAGGELPLDFRKAAAEPDAVKRAEAMRAFLDAPASPMYWEALRVCEACGKAALPVLQSLLADETRREEHWALLDSLVRAGGKASVPALEQLLRDELAFWNNLGMNLDEEAKLPARRAEHLAAMLRYLAALGYRDPHHLVLGIHDQFRDQPILRATEGPVIDAAQAILSRK